MSTHESQYKNFHAAKEENLLKELHLLTNQVGNKADFILGIGRGKDV